MGMGECEGGLSMRVTCESEFEDESYVSERERE